MSTRQETDPHDPKTILLTIIPKTCEGCKKIETCEILKNMNVAKCKTGRKT